MYCGFYIHFYYNNNKNGEKYEEKNIHLKIICETGEEI